MAKVQAITPLPDTYPTLTQLTYATSTAYPIGLSRDRATVYGAFVGATTGAASNKDLYQSVDDGTTWTLVHTFPEKVKGILELDDGSALAMTEDATSAPGYVYKSSDWSTAANHAAATWTKVLTSTAAVQFRAQWGLHQWTFGDDSLVAGTSKYGVIGEYGGQANVAGDTTKATHVFFTSDYGATWTQVLDLAVLFPTAVPIHIHTAAYDPWWDRLWVLYGDTQAGGTTTLEILYSDDHGATWNSLLTNTYDQAPYQSTTLAVLEDAIVIGSDNGPGYMRIDRKGYRRMGTPQVVTVLYGGTSSGMIAFHAYRARNMAAAPLLLAHIAIGTTTDVIPTLLASFDGLSFFEVWRDESLINIGSSGFNMVFGPTANGRIVGRVAQNNTDVSWKLYVGEFTTGETEGVTGGTATFNGDGTTTAFVIPHGLSAAPRRFTAEPGSAAAAGSSFRTADATNITVTFTTAPAAGTGNVVLNWTAGL